MNGDRIWMRASRCDVRLLASIVGTAGVEQCVTDHFFPWGTHPSRRQAALQRGAIRNLQRIISVPLGWSVNPGDAMTARGSSRGGGESNCSLRNAVRSTLSHRVPKDWWMFFVMTEHPSGSFHHPLRRWVFSLSFVAEVFREYNSYSSNWSWGTKNR